MYDRDEVAEIPNPPHWYNTNVAELAHIIYSPKNKSTRSCYICREAILPDQTVHGGYFPCHEECFMTKFLCSKCGILVNNTTKENTRIWDLDYEVKVCVACDDTFGDNCCICENRMNKNSLFNTYRWDLGSHYIGMACTGCSVVCQECESRYRPRDMRENRHGDPICQSCFQFANVIRAHDFDPMSVLTFKGNPKNRLFYGVELEVEAIEGNNNKEVALQILAAVDDFAVIKHDGSLVNGFEVVTCPASLEEHFGFWNKYFDLDLPLESYASPRCGMHVHLSRGAISPMHLARMMVFMYSANNRRLIEQIAGRNLHAGWGERYAEINSAKKITDIAGVLNGPSDIKRRPRFGEDEYFDQVRGRWTVREVPKEPLPIAERKIFKKNTNAYGRYTALNDTNNNTVEIRIFRGCNKRTTVFKNLEFCKALYDYCQPGNTSIRSLETPSVFSAFVQKRAFEYRYLYKFMEKHNLI